MTRPPTSPPPRPAPPLIGRLEVETPEHVRLDYELAGVGSRVTAAIVDHLLLGLWGIALLVVLSLFSLALEGAAIVVFVLAWGVGALGYFTFFEAFRQGQTPGKRQVGIRVVRDTGHPLTLGAALARNLLRAVDILPGSYLLGILFVFFHPRGARLGDLVAGTVVVRDRPDAAPAPSTRREASVLREGAAEDLLVGPALEESEWRLLAGYEARARELDRSVRRRVESQLATRFADRFPIRPSNDPAFLRALFRTEEARRSGRIAGAKGVVTVASRLAARQGTRWTEFEALAARAARAGLDTFAAEELPDFAARYREVSADLSRARTYGAEPIVTARLERLTAAGHNQLYVDQRQTFTRIGQVVFRECPAAVWKARRAVALALIALFAPAAAAYVVLRQDPSLAPQVLPEGMLARADAGHTRDSLGLTYYETDDGGVMASMLINNNVKVAFNCFAGGILLGVGSLILLVYNGLSLGSAAGHFANEGLGRYLFSFIVGHGVLELFAIALSGAAGFLLGLAIIAPGDLSRREALVVNGRLAIRMVGTVVLLLVLAGLIEGLLSASGASFAYRIAVSSASGAFLLLYLVNGARWASTLDGP